MKTRLIAATAVALLLLSAAARADFTGQDVTVAVTHTGVSGGLAGTMGGVHEYGTTDTYTNMFWGSWSITTPAPAGPLEPSLELDFGAFNYHGFANESGTLVLTGLPEEVAPGSVVVTSGGTPIASSITLLASGFSATWAVNDVLTFSPIDRTLNVAWTSAAPGPGALVCLAAGLAFTRRRRR